MQLAAQAVRHARREHGVELSPDRLDLIDTILGQARAAAASRPSSAASQPAAPPLAAPPLAAPPLAAWYGAWLGYWAVTKCGGEWVGLFEPCAPRVRVGGELFSPVDAVRRVIDSNPSAVPITTVAQRMLSASDEANSSRETSLPRNREAWEKLATDPRFAGIGTLPDSPERALAAIDPWVRGSGVVGRDVLCLASGGGTHAPLYAIAGARVTVVDISPRQLEHDDAVAQQLGLPIRTLCQSIDRLEALDDASFDVVVQPVSSSYVPDVRAVYRQVARVIRRGGVYVSQHKQPVALQTIASSGEGDEAAGPLRLWTPAVDGKRIPAGPDIDRAGPARRDVIGIREQGTDEFVHTLDALIGGLCDAGFVITDFQEPPRADASAPEGTPQSRARFAPPYLKIRAVRRS